MFFDVDEIKIFATTENATTGKLTEDAGTLIKCRVEEENGVIYNKEGEKIKTSGTILIDKRKLAAISYKDQIQITKKSGQVYFDAARKFKILKIGDHAPMQNGYWEVTY